MRALATASLLAVALTVVATSLSHGQQTPPKPPAPGEDLARRLAGLRAIDLGWPIDEKTPHWPEEKEPAFHAEPLASFAKDGYWARGFAMPEHYGTHIDAPAHFESGKQAVDEIPLERLTGEAVVIDLRPRVQADPDAMLNGPDVAAFERANGKIPAGAIVLVRTGWAAKAATPDAYAGREGETMHFPGCSVDGVLALLERGVHGIGIDTLSIDRGASKKFEVHHLLASAGAFAIENLNDRLADLPPRGALVVALPLKLKGGSGAPVRVLAYVATR